MFEKACGSADGCADAFQHGRHLHGVDAVGDLQGGELGVADDRGQNFAIEQVGFEIERDRGHAVAADDVFLEALPRDLGGLLLSEITEKEDEAHDVVGRRRDGIDAQEIGTALAFDTARSNLAAPCGVALAHDAQPLFDDVAG